mgnify:CR=1 FL=1
MARDKKRPFIDRRLAFLVLFQRGDPVTGADNIEKQVNDVVKDTSSSMYVTDYIPSHSPPQAKVVLSTSSATPSGLEEAANMLERYFTETNLPVQTIEVTAVALSPGDKVRNAMGV